MARRREANLRLHYQQQEDQQKRLIKQREAADREYRRQQEAVNTVEQLRAVRRTMSMAPKTLWDRAQVQLGSRYSYANAMASSAVAMKRLEFLNVREPEPGLEDFIPEALPSKNYPRLADQILADARAKLTHEVVTRKDREEARKEEVQRTEELVRSLLEDEKNVRLEAQAKLWPVDVGDPAPD